MSSRPSRNAPAPAPVPGGAYCLDCGRLMPQETKPSPTPRKYCSSACRSRAKSPNRSILVTHLAQTFHDLLSQKSSPSAVILCSEAEAQAWSDPKLIEDFKVSDKREETRRSARRIVQFGFSSQGVLEETRIVEAVQEGRVVEASFAKGEWGIRWVSR